MFKKTAPIPLLTLGPICLVISPSIASILIISAPISASNFVQYGTINTEDASIILTPFKGPLFMLDSIHFVEILISNIENYS